VVTLKTLTLASSSLAHKSLNYLPFLKMLTKMKTDTEINNIMLISIATKKKPTITLRKKH